MRKLLPVIVGVWLAAGAILGFTIAMPHQKGFEDLEGYRAVFFHMPFAFAGTLAFMIAAIHAARYLISRDRMADYAAAAAAETGLVFLLLATLTGMIFAKNQWHTWWNWDPRQTSVFFVLLIYAAYLLFRQAIGEDEQLRARLSAAYLLLAVAPMIWLVMIFPKTQNTGSLHPQQAPFERIHWELIFFQLAGLMGLYICISWLQSGIARLNLAAEE